ncbi:MAG TPA: hypothetical protein IAA26_05425 [Candidatus Blautia faecipullorum]|nr:hypothetical protein [Candidatus Blautia faecipullorum]
MEKEKTIEYLQDVYNLQIQQRIAENALTKIDADRNKQIEDIRFSEKKRTVKYVSQYIWIIAFITGILFLGFCVFLNGLYNKELSQTENRVSYYSNSETYDEFYLNGAKNDLSRAQNDQKYFSISYALGIIVIVFSVIAYILTEIKKRNEQKLTNAYVMLIHEKSQNKLEILNKNRFVLANSKSEIDDALNKLYSLNIIYKKYRDMEACGMFLEYLLSGRAQALEATQGYVGAYSLYEDELFRGVIRDKLDQVLQNQRILIKGQNEIKASLHSIENGIERVCNELSNIKGGINKLTQATEVNNFYNAVAAYNTMVTRRITEHYYDNNI